MGTDHRGVDHGVFMVGVLRQMHENPLPDTVLRPTPVSALGLNHWIDPGVESLGKFYWGDENADDAGLPGPWFP